MHSRIIAVSVLILFLILGLNQCTHCSRKESDERFQKILEPYLQKNEIFYSDWENLKKSILHANIRTPEVIQDNVVIEDLLISEILNRKEDMVIHSSLPPLKAKLYMESTYSMIGYTNEQGTGDFINDVNSVTRSISGDIDMYVVNSEVTKLERSFYEIPKANFFQYLIDQGSKYGDHRYTEFKSIFEEISQDVKENTISILVSDMIQSPNFKGENRSAEIELNRLEGGLKTLFQNKPDIAVVAIKMNAKFKALQHPQWYYRYNSSGFPFEGYRPYYIFLIGGNEEINRLLTDAQYQNVMATLRTRNGFEEIAIFSSSHSTPAYTLLTENEHRKGSFRPQRGNNPPNRIQNVERVRFDRYTQELQFAIAVNLSHYLWRGNFYLKNPVNYKVSAPFQVVEILPVSEEDIHQNERHFIANPTHLIVVKTSDRVIQDQNLEISLLNRFPDWIAASSTIHNDTRNFSRENIDEFQVTTFGIEHMLRGIHEAFEAIPGQDKYFTISLNIKP